MKTAVLRHYDIAMRNTARANEDVCLVPLNRILMVGGLVEESLSSKFNVLSREDTQYLVRLAGLLPQYGYRIGENPEISVANLNYGDDFLLQQAQADLLVLAYIYYQPDSAWHNRGRFAQSELSHQEGTWHRAAQNTNARVLVNVHASGNELPTRLFNHAPFHLLDTHRFGYNIDVFKHDAI